MKKISIFAILFSLALFGLVNQSHGNDRPGSLTSSGNAGVSGSKVASVGSSTVVSTSKNIKYCDSTYRCQPVLPLDLTPGNQVGDLLVYKDSVYKKPTMAVAISSPTKRTVAILTLNQANDQWVQEDSLVLSIPADASSRTLLASSDNGNNKQKIQGNNFLAVGVTSSKKSGIPGGYAIYSHLESGQWQSEMLPSAGYGESIKSITSVNVINNNEIAIGMDVVNAQGVKQSVIKVYKYGAEQKLSVTQLNPDEDRTTAITSAVAESTTKTDLTSDTSATSEQTANNTEQSTADCPQDVSHDCMICQGGQWVNLCDPQKCEVCYPGGPGGMGECGTKCPGQCNNGLCPNDKCPDGRDPCHSGNCCDNGEICCPTLPNANPIGWACMRTDVCPTPYQCDPNYQPCTGQDEKCCPTPDINGQGKFYTCHDMLSASSCGDCGIVCSGNTPLCCDRVLVSGGPHCAGCCVDADCNSKGDGYKCNENGQCELPSDCRSGQTPPDTCSVCTQVSLEDSSGNTRWEWKSICTANETCQDNGTVIGSCIPNYQG